MGSVEVFVCVFVDGVITLQLNPSTTVDALMSRILADESSPAIKKAMDRIRDRGGQDYLLLYQGLNLLDHPSVVLHDKAELILSRKGPIRLRLQSFPSMADVGEILVDALEPVRKVKEKVDLLATVDKVKREIPRRIKDNVSSLHLYYCYFLMGDDDKPLAYYGMFKRTDTVDVDPTDSFQYLIIFTYAQYKEGLPFNPGELLSSSRRSTSLKITVESPSSFGPVLLSIAVKGNDKIDKVKSEICAMVPKDEARSAFAFILEGLYMLMFNRMVLEDHSLTLDECGIKNGDTIQLCPNGEFKVTVILVLGDVPPIKKIHAVSVKSSETVAMLRRKILGCEGISPEKELLMRYKQKLLVDDQTCLLEHGIVQLPRTRRYKYGCGNGYFGTNCVVEAVTYG